MLSKSVPMPHVCNGKKGKRADSKLMILAFKTLNYYSPLSR
ncbi:hypothetical protein B4168_2912 [Anoxybacillus flavithermus]|nr:hypothetical protein B4168_2912 [Anoxybacillus flavithermus]OAO86201.1 hypothetical protein GT23_2094 [Parageobacillus thermoglucosidasius]